MKREPWFTVGGNVSWYATMENSMEIAKKKKLKIELHNDPELIMIRYMHLGMYLQKIKH